MWPSRIITMITSAEFGRRPQWERRSWSRKEMNRFFVPFWRPAIRIRKTNSKRRNSQPAEQVGGIEVYEGKKIIREGGQSLELYPVSFPEHVDPMVLAYASSARALFQPDLYTPPAAANGGPPAQHLLQAITELNLKVDTMVGGHGGIGTFADFVKSARPAASSN